MRLVLRYIFFVLFLVASADAAIIGPGPSAQPYSTVLNGSGTSISATCTSKTGSTHPSRDMIKVTLSGATQYATPSTASGCIEGDLIDGFFIQADNQNYQVSITDGAGTNHTGTLLTVPTSTGTNQGYFLHFTFQYHASLAQWELVDQKTNPPAPYANTEQSHTISGNTTASLSTSTITTDTLTFTANATVTLPKANSTGQTYNAIVCQDSVGGHTALFTPTVGLTIIGTFPAFVTTPNQCGDFSLHYTSMTQAAITGSAITLSTTTNATGPTTYVFPQTFGAVADGQVYYNGAMTNSSATLSDSTDAPFTTADVGKAICVSGTSGVYGPLNNAAFSSMPMSELCGTIAGYISASQVTLSFTSMAGVNQTGQTFRYGTDNTTAIQNTLNSCATNGCTVFFNGAFVVTGSISVPTAASVNLLGNASYAPDANYNNGHTPQGAASGMWWETKALTQAALIYGGTASNGANVQNILYTLRNIQLIGGAGSGPCTPHGGACTVGWSGTLDGGGSDGIWVHGMQHIHIEDSAISNFQHDCITAYGAPVEFIELTHNYIEYCGHNGINLSSGNYTPQMMLFDNEIEGMGDSCVFYSPYSGNEVGDTFTVIGNTIASCGALADGTAYNVDIESGRYHIVEGNWFETGGQGSVLGICHNSGGGDAAGHGSQLWIANHYGPGPTYSCDNIQMTVGDALPTCTQSFAGSDHWVVDGAGTPAQPACGYGAVYNPGDGTATCKIGCDGTSWRYGY